jgi:response regulator of citrate/malate metabolism
MKSKELILTLTRKVYDLEGRLKAVQEELQIAQRELDEAFSGVTPAQEDSDEPEGNTPLRTRIMNSLSRKPKKTRELFDDLNRETGTVRNTLNTYLTRMKNDGIIARDEVGLWSVRKG